MSLKKKQRKTPGKEKQPSRPFSVENVFDENSFDFHLSGGPFHTDLLMANATFKIGDKNGEPVPIKCKWFNIKEDGQLLEIENVSGAFYQPCVEDVGSKIYVQATPISSLEEYCGMPVFAEIGPLVMSKEIEQKVMLMLEKSQCVMTSRMDSINFPLVKDGKNYQTCLPQECQITIDQNFLTLNLASEGDKKAFQNEILKFPLGLNFPFIKICRMTNNVYEIHLEKEQMIRMMAENNVIRDIIAISLKMLCGQKILEYKFLDSESSTEKSMDSATIKPLQSHEEEVKQEVGSPKAPENGKTKEKTVENSKTEPETTVRPKPSVSDFELENMKTPQKEASPKLKDQKQIEPCEEKNENSLPQNNAKKVSMDLMLRVEQQAKDIAQLVHDNEHLKREKLDLIEELSHLKKEKEQFSTELFNAKRNYMEALRENEQSKSRLEKFINEKNFLVQDLSLYKSQIKENEEQIAGLEAKLRQMSQQHEAEMATQTQAIDSQAKENERMVGLEKEILALKGEIRILNDQLQMKLGTIRELCQSNEDLENKVNYLKKKNESLQHETSKNYQTFERTTNEDQDIEKLQTQIVACEKTIKELKKDLEEEKARKGIEVTSKFELSSLASIISNIVLVKSSNQQLLYMQKLANNLTEVIADRELALENQKSINKELIKRINELTEQKPKENKEN